MKGLNKDYNIINQPPETYTFAFNATATTNESKFANLSNEPSNEFIHAVPLGYTIYGSIFTNDSTIIFSGNGVNSEIGELKDDVYETLITDVEEDCKLNFNTIIKGREFRIRAGCDRTIYWSDNLNPDRYLNLDDTSTVFTNNALDCNKFIFNRNIQIPIVNTVVNNQGGLIKSGSYSFVVEYLDDSENVIYKSIPTKFVPIFSDSLNNNYDDIYGSLNIDQFAASVGGTPLTNKSITLTINNIDQTVSFIRINVIQSNTSTGEILTAHTIGTLLPIVQEEQIFTYTGVNVDNGDILIAYDSLVTRTVAYNSSRSMEQVQNRLVRANVTEKTRDYSSYQRIANNITVEPFVRPVRTKELNGFRAKDPNGYLNKSFQGDEVYALGIVYIHDDSSESPVMHIPGRSKLEVDTTIIPYNINNPDLQHLPIKDTYESWEVYNTGQYDNTTRRLSYYEGDQLYPTTLDCNEEFIYGDLAGTPIRHHKMLCRKEVVLQYGEGGRFLNYLGLKFNNVQYPDSSIIAHRFVYVKRNDYNKTVLDTGFSTSLHRNEANSTNESEWFVSGGEIRNTNDTPVQPNTIVNSTEFHHFVSPKVLGKLYTGGSHFKFNYQFDHNRNSNLQVDTDKDGGGFFRSINTHYTINDIIDTTPYYRTYTNNVFVQPNSTQTINSNDVLNFSQSNNSNIILFENDVLDQGLETYYVYNKRYFKPYENLQSLRYSSLSPVLLSTSTYTSFDGDTFINELNTISIFQYTINNDDIFIRSNSFASYYVESDINYDLRVEGLDCNLVWDGKEENATFHTLRKAGISQGNSYVVREGNQVCQEYYYYNRDFDILSAYITIPLPNNYDYCDRCLTKKPNRIIFSPKSFDEEIGDFYLYNYVNDYIDIPQEKGDIVAIKYKNNKLYVHCTDSTFVLQPNPQAISTDQNIAYLTTGDFLSIPPVEMMTTDLGYGGMQYELANINTEFGYFWVDQKRGQIFKLADSVESITNKGLSMWFKENLTNNTELAYDPYFQRIIISHKENSNVECNKQFTLSFFPFYDAFISFYGYMPDLMFSTHNNFYTIKSNSIWKHLKKSSYLSFYGKLQPFIIEEVKNDFSTDNLNAIYFYTEFFEDINNNLNILHNKSYDQLVVYNNNQSTGVLDLKLINQSTNPYDNIYMSPNEKSIIITDENSKVSNLYDLSTSNIISQKPCLSGAETYTDLEFINTDAFKSQYDYANFRNKYIKARLIYNPQTTNTKLIHYLTQINESQSIR